MCYLTSLPNVRIHTFSEFEFCKHLGNDAKEHALLMHQWSENLNLWVNCSQGPYIGVFFSWVAFVFGSLDWNVAWLVHGQSHREHVALLIFGHQGVGYFIGCRSLIGDRRNSVYAWTLKVWERKRRMGRAKHSSEKGTPLLTTVGKISSTLLADMACFWQGLPRCPTLLSWHQANMRHPSLFIIIELYNMIWV